MKWSGGLAEWHEGGTVFLSIAFTWKLDEAYGRAVFARAQGLKVRAGGPGLFLKQSRHKLEDVAEVGGTYPEAVTKHNPLATFASRGCSETCSFCIVPKLEGPIVEKPDFVPRPVLCDNNLSALSPGYQDYVVERYRAAGVQLLDANSGFEPKSFTPEVYARWKGIINEGGGPWRFAYDDMQERDQALAVMRMLRSEPARRKQVYVIIGNEPYAECMQRIYETLAEGCEVHVQPLMKLNATDRRTPHVKHDWTVQKLRQVARWANGRAWRSCPRFEDFKPAFNTHRVRYDAQQGLFL